MAYPTKKRRRAVNPWPAGDPRREVASAPAPAQVVEDPAPAPTPAKVPRPKDIWRGARPAVSGKVGRVMTARLNPLTGEADILLAQIVRGRGYGPSVYVSLDDYAAARRFALENAGRIVRVVSGARFLGGLDVRDADEKTCQGQAGLKCKTLREAIRLASLKHLEWGGPLKIVFNSETRTFEPVKRRAALGPNEEVALALTSQTLDTLYRFETAPLRWEDHVSRLLGMGDYN